MTDLLDIGYAFGDTETGGLDPRINPLVSVAFVFAHPITFAELDGFVMKVKPPEGTLLEVPVVAEQFPGDPKKKYGRRLLQHYLDIYTGKAYNDPGEALVLTAGAVEINGFIQPNADGKWDMASYKTWLDKQAVPLAVAERTLLAFIEKAFAPNAIVIGCAHNADFDQKFIAKYLPGVDKRMWRRPAGAMSLYPYRDAREDYNHDWFCTMLAMQKLIGQRKGSKLSDLAAKYGHVNPGAHEALNDCRAGVAGLKGLSADGYGPKFAAAAAS